MGIFFLGSSGIALQDSLEEVFLPPRLNRSFLFTKKLLFKGAILADNNINTIFHYADFYRRFYFDNAV